MKLTHTLFYLSLIGLVFLSACDDSENQKSEEQLYLEKLSATWEVEEVILDDELVTEFYSGMVLTVKADKTFSVENAVEPVWSSAGAFTLQKSGAGSDEYKFLRSDDVEITITELTATTLVYTFQYTPPGGRQKSIGGGYIFSMTKK